MAGDPDLNAVIEAALADIRAAHDRAVERIMSEPDLDRAFEAAGALVIGVGQVHEEGGEVRRDRARKIRDKEKLSLAKLADRWGVSKARADQLLKRKTSGEREEEPDDE